MMSDIGSKSSGGPAGVMWGPNAVNGRCFFRAVGKLRSSVTSNAKWY